MHQDCEGHIPVRYTMPLAERLEELLPYIAEWDAVARTPYHDKTKILIAGLRRASARQEPLQFF